MLKRTYRQPIWFVGSTAVTQIFSDRDNKWKMSALAHHRVTAARKVVSVRVFRAVFRTLFVFVACTVIYFIIICDGSRFRKERRLLMKKTLVKVPDVRVYLYSAIGVRYESQANQSTAGSIFETDRDYNTMVITGWEHNAIMYTEYSCCFWLQNNSVIQVRPNTNETRYGNTGSTTLLKATRYACPLEFHHTLINSVSLTFWPSSCGYDRGSFMEPSFPPPRNRTGLALCTKVAYGRQNPDMLLEWFEIQKALGVDKVLAFLYLSNLDEDSLKIFKYYESVGFAEIVQHDIPEKDIIPREVGQPTMQCYNDDRVTLLDCEERLYGYKYVGILDKDEVILPSNLSGHAPLIRFLEENWRNESNLAGVRFFTRFHPLERRETQVSQEILANETLFLHQFPQCSLPMIDRPKYIYMPTGIQQGTIHSHSYESKANYIKKTIKPTEAVLHHFRLQREDWTREKATKMDQDKLSYCSDMQHLLEHLRTNMTHLKQRFGIIYGSSYMYVP